MNIRVGAILPDIGTLREQNNHCCRNQSRFSPVEEGGLTQIEMNWVAGSAGARNYWIDVAVLFHLRKSP